MNGQAEYDNDQANRLAKENTPFQLLRLYRKAWLRMIDGDGYQAYGYDWTTLLITKPGWADQILTLQVAMLYKIRMLLDPDRRLPPLGRVLPPREWREFFRPITQPQLNSLSDRN